MLVENENMFSEKMCNETSHQTEMSATELFHKAIKSSEIESIEELLAGGVNINALNGANESPISMAVRNKNVQIVQLFLRHGCDLNYCKDNKTLLHLAFESTNEFEMEEESKQIGQLLVNAWHNVNIETVHLQYGSLLHFLAFKGYIDFVQFLLVHNVDVNCCDDKGQTALFHAILGNQLNMVKYLLQCGANICSANENGDTPLHIAVGTPDSKKEMIKLLLSYNANVNTKNIFGVTPIFTAVRQGRVTIAKLLLFHDAKVNLIDEEYVSPLYIAARRGSSTMFSLLLEHGADINCATSMENKSILDAVHDQFKGDGGEKNEFSVDKPCEKTIIDIKEHIAKLKVVGFDVSKMNLKIIGNEMVDFEQKCSNELQKMHTKIPETTISFYNILKMKSNHELALYFKNDFVMKAFESNQYRIEFPIYSKLIHLQCLIGSNRAKLLKPMYTFLEDNFQILPYNILNHICSFLSDNDLKSFQC